MGLAVGERSLPFLQAAGLFLSLFSSFLSFSLFFLLSLFFSSFLSSHSFFFPFGTVPLIFQYAQPTMTEEYRLIAIGWFFLSFCLFVFCLFFLPLFPSLSLSFPFLILFSFSSLSLLFLFSSVLGSYLGICHNV